MAEEVGKEHKPEEHAGGGEPDGLVEEEIICRECSAPFPHTVEDQRFFIEKVRHGPGRRAAARFRAPAKGARLGRSS
jgi:hypothetical protein